MKTEDQIKEVVKQKYSEVALQQEQGCDSKCGTACCTNSIIMDEDYSQLEGYNADADMGLGCGLPTQFAGIKKGDTVVDLGSGAGNDCFVARAEVGESGKVIGIDFSPQMIAKAKTNVEKRGFTNVEFYQSDIEETPLLENSTDVVISNCVLNLLPSKDKIFHEILRVLKSRGHFCISDIVSTEELPEQLRNAAELYVGCVSGALKKDLYISKIVEAGFEDIKIVKEKVINIPQEILDKYLSKDKLDEYKHRNTGIYSITVTGIKPKNNHK